MFLVCTGTSANLDCKAIPNKIQENKWFQKQAGHASSQAVHPELPSRANPLLVLQAPEN